MWTVPESEAGLRLAIVVEDGTDVHLDVRVAAVAVLAIVVAREVEAEASNTGRALVNRLTG